MKKILFAALVFLVVAGLFAAQFVQAAGPEGDGSQAVATPGRKPPPLPPTLDKPIPMKDTGVPEALKNVRTFQESRPQGPPPYINPAWGVPELSKTPKPPPPPPPPTVERPIPIKDTGVPEALRNVPTFEKSRPQGPPGPITVNGQEYGPLRQTGALYYRWAVMGTLDRIYWAATIKIWPKNIWNDDPASYWPYVRLMLWDGNPDWGQASWVEVGFEDLGPDGLWRFTYDSKRTPNKLWHGQFSRDNTYQVAITVGENLGYAIYSSVEGEPWGDPIATGTISTRQLIAEAGLEHQSSTQGNFAQHDESYFKDAYLYSDGSARWWDSSIPTYWSPRDQAVPLRYNILSGPNSYGLETWSTYLHPETSITQELENPADRDSVVQVPVNVDRVFDFLGRTYLAPGGIRFYEAIAIYSPAGINIQQVRGAPNFPNPHPVIDNNGGNTRFWEWATDPKPQPPVVVAKLVPRLVGCATNRHVLTVDFLNLIADQTGENIQEEIPVGKFYQRGDAKEDRVVDIVDANYIAQYVVYLRPLSDLNAVNAAGPKHDDTFDYIDIVDALFIAQYLNGLRDCYYNWQGSAAGVQGGTATVQLGSAQLAAGARAVVPIVVKDVTSAYGLGAYTLRIAFDPKVVRVDAVQPGDGSFAPPAAYNIDNGRGVVLLDGFQPAIPGPRGDVTVAKLALTAVGAAGSSTALDVSVLTLADSLGNDIGTTTVSGSATVR